MGDPTKVGHAHARRRDGAFGAWHAALRIGVRAAGWPPFVGLVLALTTSTFTPGSVYPGDALDLDYRAALEWAAARHIAFGPHFTFTYGPLGFLGSPFLFFGAPAALSLLFFTLVAAATGAVLYSALRRSTSGPAAALFAYVVMVMAPAGIAVEVLAPLGLVWAVWLSGRVDGRWTSAAIVLAGCFTSVAAMIKVSLGPSLLVIFVLGLALRRTALARSAAAFGCGLVGAALAVWVGMGDHIGDLPAWLGESGAFISGYQAMAYETRGRLYMYWLAGAGILAVLVLAGIRGARSDEGWRSRSWGTAFHVAGWVVMVAAGCEVVFRESFARHDARDVLFFASLPLLLVAACPRGWRPALRIQPALVAVAALFGLVAGGSVPAVAARPVTSARHWVSTARTELSASQRHRIEVLVRTKLQSSYNLPAAWLADMRGQPVVDLPMGDPIAWIYPQLEWAPLPTLQEYTAYTPALDNLDARYLSGVGAPKWALFLPLTIDGRNPAWDSPAVNVAMRCSYRSVASDSEYLSLLEHTADMCGSPVTLRTVHARLGQTVAVPAAPAGMALVATFQIGPSLLGSLAGLALKGATYSVVADSTRYRFIAESGASPHLLSWPLTGTGSLPAPTVHTLRLVSNDPALSAGGATIRFSAIPVHAVR